LKLNVVKLFNYVIKPTIVLIIGHFSTCCKILRNSAEMQTFRGKRQIPQLGSKFHGLRKTVRPTDKICAIMLFTITAVRHWTEVNVVVSREHSEHCRRSVRILLNF